MLAPWTPPRRLLSESLARVVEPDAAAVWLLQPEQPRPDELLACDRLSPTAIRQWCDRGYREDRLLRDAVAQGQAEGTLRDTGLSEPGLPPDTEVVYLTVQETIPQRRWWVVALFRSKGKAPASTRESVGLLLRQWQASLNRTEDPEAARLLAGCDDRLISADPGYHQALLRLGLSTHELLSELRRVREQRWDHIADDEPHDLVMQIAGQPFWIVFRRTRAVDLPDAAQWHIDLLPTREQNLPPVGVIADQRVARALAYIHDRFPENPSLASIASRVHVSQYHFHRVFSRLVGVSPKRYLQLRQIQAAKRLLRTTHTPIHEIARAVGFASHGQFTATFRRIAEASPSEYRARIGQS